MHLCWCSTLGKAQDRQSAIEVQVLQKWGEMDTQTAQRQGVVLWY